MQAPMQPHAAPNRSPPTLPHPAMSPARTLPPLYPPLASEPARLSRSCFPPPLPAASLSCTFKTAHMETTAHTGNGHGGMRRGHTITAQAAPPLQEVWMVRMGCAGQLPSVSAAQGPTVQVLHRRHLEAYLSISDGLLITHTHLYMHVKTSNA